MRVYHSIEEFERLPVAVATTGTFDGVHKGHQLIIGRLCEVAKRVGGESVLLTFSPHPRQILQPERPLKLLNSLDEKTELLAQMGLDHLIVHPFSLAFSRTTSLEFVRNILVQKIGVKRLVIGYDHHFGRNREGSFAYLKEFGPLYGFQVEEIPAHDIDEVAVSSTKIRKALELGEIEKANGFLGYPYGLSGKVVEGDAIGRTLGFPTANLQLNDENKHIPANGVYAVMVKYDDKLYKGMCNLGERPTVSGNTFRIEVHLFDFDGLLYNKTLKLSFYQRLRDEQRFNSLDGLIKQLQMDAEKAQSVLSGFDGL